MQRDLVLSSLAKSKQSRLNDEVIRPGAALLDMLL
jgi:hypothetical protein